MSTPVPPANIVLDLTRSWGQILIGVFLATALWGATCLQTLTYFTKYDSDSRAFKGYVVLLWILDTVHEIISIKGLWQILIPKFGDLVTVASLPAELLIQLIVTGCIEALAQSFLIWRIWRFSGHKWIFPVVLLPPTLWQLVGSIIYTAQGLGKPAAFLATPGMKKLALSVNATTAIIDVSIAACMCTLLWRGKSGFEASDRIIARLMNATVNTGAWTALFALISVITLAAYPDDLFYSLWYYPLCALYSNAVLGNLNSRNYMKRGNSPAVSTGPSSGGSIPLSSLANSSGPFKGSGRGKRITSEEEFAYPGRSMAVHVETNRTFDDHDESTIVMRSHEKV